MASNVTYSSPDVPEVLTGGACAERCAAVSPENRIECPVSLRPLSTATWQCFFDSHFYQFIKRSAITIEGETAVFQDTGSSGLPVARRYRPKCGSPLTTEADVTPDLMFGKAGGIDSNQ